MTIVPRTCTELREDDGQARSVQVSSLRSLGAYVLLGAPGAGKTEAFKQESREDCNGELVTARDFLTFDEKNRPEWRGCTLYIDALDEVRAGESDGRTPLDRIRAKLDTLGRPRFRLSCREADWFGANDRHALRAVAQGGEVGVFRLDPLSDEEIKAALQGKGAANALQVFVDEARARGIGGLLTNPLTLIMLWESVVAEDWPDSRSELFERSCERLIRERNEHVHAKPVPSDAALLRLARQLCAVQLLTGASGIRQRPAPQLADSPGELLASSFPDSDAATRQAALKTRLFEVKDAVATPTHRQIAEFLAARHLADRIDEGLPAARVLALLTAEDGGIPSEMRGLAAWLAAHCQTMRKDIVQRDPLGTVLYGDVRGFPLAEKTTLLGCLERIADEDPWSLPLYYELDARWGDIATPDMTAVLRRVLGNVGATPGSQVLGGVLLQSLQRGATVPDLRPLLMDTARDEGLWGETRRLAMEAFVSQGGDLEEVRTLLDEVAQGTVADSDDELLGGALEALYPAMLSAQDIGRHFRSPSKPGLSGRFSFFWLYSVLEKSTAKQLGEVLDSVCQVYPDLGVDASEETPDFLVAEVPRRLLASYLEREAESVAADRLCEWLRLINDRWRKDKYTKEIRAWLAARPELIGEVLAAGLQNALTDRDAWAVLDRLPCALPDSLATWFADQAIERPELADFMLFHAINLSDRGGAGRVDHAVRQRLSRDHNLRARYDEAVERRARDSKENERRRQRSRQVTESRRPSWRNDVAPVESELRENRAKPRLLHGLAQAYVDRFTNVAGDTGRDRLLSLLDGDEGLVETVLGALRAAQRRPDLPDEKEVLRLVEKGEVHYLSLPLLVSLELEPTELDESQLRRALAIHFNVRPAPDDAEWYRAAAAEHPQIVADSLVRSVRRAWRNGDAHSLGVDALSVAPHDAVTEAALPKLLAAFPTRAGTGQLPALKRLLEVALHRRPNGLLGVVERKLASSSMPIAQRMHWLCGGLLAHPTKFRERLRSELSKGGEMRVRHVAACLGGRLAKYIDRFDPPALGLLVERLGASFGPPALEPNVVHVVTGPIEAADLIRDMVAQLAAIPAASASEQLDALCEHRSLGPWRNRLVHARTQQHALRREAEFRHATAEQVLETLDGADPANSADLQALTVEVLEGLAKEIRDGDTSDWRQYWEGENPLKETECRNRFLSDLRLRLEPFGVRADPEVQHADDRRADFRVSFEEFHVPVEVKTTMSRDLWSAIADQLIPSYARDPKAAGTGILLVFWFGAQKWKTAPSGERLHTPEELRDALEKALTSEQARLISVCVVDVSRPSGTTQR